MHTASPATGRRTAPPLWALHVLFLMTGTGTTMLGPILPLLSRTWSLHDSQAGMLLTAQFLGAFLGGVTVGSHVRRVLLTASAAAAAGLAGLALSSAHAGGLPFALASLLLAGFGIGHMIAANNIIGGQLPVGHRGRNLTLLNLSWSVGAILSPVLAAWLLPHLPLHTVLTGFGGLFAAACFAIYARIHPPDKTSEAVTQSHGSTTGILVFFSVMLLLYGGVETSMSGWLTTYILRYGDHTLSGSQLSTSLFWIALIAGRLAAAGALSWLGERAMLRLALAATGICISALANSNGPVALTSCAILLGIAMSPTFPVCFSLFMGYRPRARQAGLALAMTGIGAALIPWFTGLVSTRSGSLHIALIVPLLTAAAMLLMSFTLPRAHSSFPDSSGV